MRVIRGLIAAALVAATAAACASPYDTRYGAYDSGYHYRTNHYYPSGYYYPVGNYSPRGYFIAFAAP